LVSSLIRGKMHNRMAVLLESLPYPLKKLSLSGILCRVTQYHRTFG